MTAAYEDLGGQPATVTTPHERFHLALSRHIHVDRTAALGTALDRMFANGWEPEALAVEVAQKWPRNVNHNRVMLHRLAMRADTLPPSATVPNKPHAGVCNHAIPHQCPWLDELDDEGRAVRCDCKEGD